MRTAPFAQRVTVLTYTACPTQDPRHPHDFWRHRAFREMVLVAFSSLIMLRMQSVGLMRIEPVLPRWLELG